MPTTAPASSDDPTVASGHSPSEPVGSDDLDGDRTRVPNEVDPNTPTTPAVRPHISALELQRGTLVGRYVVLGRLGAGGMGIVYDAFDPELKRTIAVKLLLGSSGPEARTLLLREAAAMARLNHPNVVTVHDVGLMADQVWLAMEFVDGQTFGAWRRDNLSRWDEGVRILRAVGAGLSAAHQAGLVHRDLKPENVMIGKDGRVRIMDFGLAREVDPAPVSSSAPTELSIERPGAPVGTPRYMPPEQFNGAAADARADQFSYCVMLWETVYGAHPFAGNDQIGFAELMMRVCDGEIRAPDVGYAAAPRWQRQILLRGLQKDPRDRYPSIDALLQEFDRGQRWMIVRRALVVFGLLIVAGAAIYAAVLAIHTYRQAQQKADCEAVGVGIADVWNATVERQMGDALHATGVANAETTLEKTVPWIARWVESWSRTRTEACLAAELHGTLPAEIYERSRVCLDEGRQEFANFVEIFGRANASDVQNMVRAATRLPDVASCLDPATLERRAAGESRENRERGANLRSRFLQARSLEAAGKYAEALELAESTLSESEARRDLPTTVEARYLVGRNAGFASEFKRAEEVLRPGFIDAGALGLDETAARIATELSFTVGYEGERVDEGRMWAQSAYMFVRRLGLEDSILAAEVLDNHGSVESAGRDFKLAENLHRRAWTIYARELGVEHPTVAIALNNLANAVNQQGRHTEALALFGEALDLVEQIFGDDHPKTARFLSNLASIENTLKHLDVALASIQRALQIQEAAFGSEDPQVAFTLITLGSIEKNLGHYEDSRNALERALAIQEHTYGPDHSILALVLNHLGVLAQRQSRLDDAERFHRRALAIYETANPDHPDISDELDNLGRVAEARGEYRQARIYFLQSLERVERQRGPDHPRASNGLRNLADIDAIEADYTAAESRYERALGIRRRIFGAAHEDTLEVLIALGDLDIQREHHDAAAQRLQGVLATMKPALDPEHIQVAAARASLARALQGLGRHEEAWDLLASAREIHTRTTVADTNSRAQTLAAMGVSGLTLGRFEESLPLVEQAVALYDTTHAPPADILTAQWTLAKLLWEAPQGKGRDRQRAHVLAQAAVREASSREGSPTLELAAVRSWIATHRP